MEENELVNVEGDNEDHEPVGTDLMELAEVLKWQKAVEAANDN